MELLPTGLQLDTLGEIVDELNQAALAGIAPTLNLNAPDPIAVMNGVVAERLESIEQLVGAMYSGMIPDNATGDQLTGLCLITGTARQPSSCTRRGPPVAFARTVTPCCLPPKAFSRVSASTATPCGWW